MANNITDTLPYTAPAWLGKVVEEFRRSLPSQVDLAWVTQRLRLPERSAGQFLGVLQRMGWVDDKGALTERARGLRQVGEPYQRHMEEMARELYPVLLPRVEQEDGFDLERLREYITNATELGESARQQIARTFRWFLHEAGMTALEERIWGAAGAREGAAPAAARPSRRPSGGPQRTARSGRTGQPLRQREPRSPFSGARVSLVVNINIPADATADQIQAILAQLAALFPGGAAGE